MINFSETHLPRMQRQAGGTVLGVIVGLIVGLAIAVVVAVMISKATLPFTNKQAQPERPATAAAGQIADPNKALYGSKDAAREAAKNTAAAVAPAPPENAVIPDARPPVVDKSTQEKTRLAEAAAADAKLSAMIAARSANSATASSAANNSVNREKLALVRPDAGEEKWVYFLQAGAFRETNDAENAKAKLALMGFEANISERPSDSGPLYRVRIGPFNQLEVMTRARSKLSDNGVDVAVVRTAR